MDNPFSEHNYNGYALVMHRRHNEMFSIFDLIPILKIYTRKKSIHVNLSFKMVVTQNRHQ